MQVREIPQQTVCKLAQRAAETKVIAIALVAGAALSLQCRSYDAYDDLLRKQLLKGARVPPAN